MSLLKAGSVLKQWTLRNEDTGESVQGQFFAKIGMEIRNNWQHHTAVSRSRSVTMFINSEEDRLTIPVMFYAKHTGEIDLNQAKIEKIFSWAKPTDPEMRPAVCTFFVGSGWLERKCVIAAISDVEFGEPTVMGHLRECKFTLNLDSYTEFNINEKANYETRYHRARERDYYEMLCWREYKQPLLGEVIRKRHPEKQQIVTGDVIKLPSIEAIRSSKIAPDSVQLSGAFGRKDTPQRALRIEHFNLRNKRYTSHVIKS